MQPTVVFDSSASVPGQNSLDVSRANVGFVAGDRPHFSEETATLLRNRLSAAAVVIAVVLGAALNLPMAKYILQLRNSVQRRYDSAMKTLILVKDKLPAIERANREHLRQQGKIVPFPMAASS